LLLFKLPLLLFEKLSTFLPPPAVTLNCICQLLQRAPEKVY
jgi:hypothetical protein